MYVITMAQTRAITNLLPTKLFLVPGMLPLLREDACKESEQDVVIWRVGDLWTNFTPCSGD